MVLITAFEAFGGDRLNPAREAALQLSLPGVMPLILPVEYETAARMAVDAIEKYRPEAVIDLGQAGGRTGITPEKFAVNLRNARSADNAGRVCENEPIVPGGPDRIESRFGAEDIVSALREAGLPAYVSEGAGTYVCNDVMYSVLYHLRNTSVRAGFIHLPFCAEQADAHPGAFTMELGEMVRGLEIAVATVIGRTL